MNGQIERKEGTAPAQLDRLSSSIATVAYKPRGESIVTLQDGQVWEEAELVTHEPLHVGDPVTIRRGVLGAFYMSTQHVLGLRVRRVK